MRDADIHATRLKHPASLSHHLRDKVKVILSTQLRIKQGLGSSVGMRVGRVESDGSAVST